MTKDKFIEKFSEVFGVEFQAKELNDLWKLIKKYGDEEKLYFFEWRLNFSFHNELNKEL